ncbi:MAG TPA: alpha-isopropylmalate synthase regulatory domain-containing protein, partial [Pirellulales bacterium]|nr:alpha-isopropylmalate synthase regulatory domain-containing protein [Pirellulales bacterium]
EIYDADIAALIDDEIRDAPDLWTIRDYRLETATGTVPSVRLTLARGNDELTREVTSGDGPFDALFWAIEQITGIEVVCKDFRVHSVSVGKDAQAEVTVEVEHGGRPYRGRGVSTDSVEASAKAFLNAINRVAAAGGASTQRVTPYETPGGEKARKQPV